MTTLERLTAIRSRVSQHHTIVAGEMLDALIADLENQTRIQKIVSSPANRRTNGRKPNCRYGRKYTKNGVTRNRKHQCGPECQWTTKQCLEWAHKPITMLTPSGKLIQVARRLVPLPPCANCDRTRADHWEPAADKQTGRLTGYRAIKECTYQTSAAPATISCST